MAPSSGHLLVPKIVRIVKFGISKTTAIIKSKLSTQSTAAASQYFAQPIRVYAQNQPTHPIAFLKQNRSSNQNRWFSSATRTFTSSSKTHGTRYDRSKFPTSRISRAIAQRGLAPFASTLRPNLIGGALPRSAGGYGLSGAGARHFSHTSGAQAQVIQTVSTGIRAFILGGGKARFDGVDPITGEKRFRSGSQTEDAVYTRWESPLAKTTRGTNLEFRLSPCITALSSIPSSGNPNLLDDLATDFARVTNDLAATLADLRILSELGDLPKSLINTPSGPMLRVRFPGCDGHIVSRLCDELGIRRGIIVEDEVWDTEKDVEMALLFPFAPTDSDHLDESDNGEEYFERISPGQGHRPEELEWRNMLSPSARTPCGTNSAYTLSPPPNNNAFSSYESLEDSDYASNDPYYNTQSPLKTPTHSTSHSTDYDGLEGIYRFLKECEHSKR